jgi:hypothetical protein
MANANCRKNCAARQTTLRAAAAAVDLAPRAGQWMTGYAARVTPATGVHDPLWARALLLEHGARRVMLIVCDVIGLHATLVNTLRACVRKLLAVV